MTLKLSLVGITNIELIKKYKDKISEIFEAVKNKSAVGSEMTGWIEWVNKQHSTLINKGNKLRDFWLKQKVDTVVIIGTGGSYIGAKAAFNFCNSAFKAPNFNFIFVPYFSERYLYELKQTLINVKFAIVIISKSGTTLESAVAFRILRELLYKKEKENYKNLIVAITDKNKGTLRNLVNKEGFDSFVIEDDIGGRYSTLTAVGLIPMLLSGINVIDVLDGAKQAYKDNFHGNIMNNSAALYASARHFLFKDKGLVSECIACYDPHLNFVLEKMKQLFAESEGKKNQGLMPILFNFTPDLHSVGQLLQDGKKTFFETTVLVLDNRYSFNLEKSSFEDDDKLDWLSGTSLFRVNRGAFEGTLDAHVNHASIPNVVIELKSWEPFTFGYIYYWLSLVAMFSAYLFGVNPFDQPGVEIYKKRMFEILGKK